MSTCFVIQPFDGGKFDQRYNDTLAPAIREVGLEPYRVDQDPRSEIPIEDIEAGIRNATVVLAEISEDNPNVWYELGYALAARKTTVMICDESRKTFPFDIRHRTVIKYKTDSASDWINLKGKIVARIKALLSKAETMQMLSSNDAVEIEGLKPYEIAMLTAIIGSSPSGGDRVYSATVQREMTDAGFTSVAFGVAGRLLSDKGLVEQFTIQSDDDYGSTDTLYRLTPTGWEWVLKNEDSFTMTRPTRPVDDEIPF